VLVINHVYPDDLGTISFEAYNPLGVAVTTALFAVEGTNMVYSAYSSLNNLNQLLFGFVSKILFQIFGAAFYKMTQSLPNPISIYYYPKSPLHLYVIHLQNFTQENYIKAKLL